MLQHAVVCHDLFLVLLLRFHRDRVSLVGTKFYSLAYSFCRDRVSSITTDLFFGSLTICLAKFVVLTILCRDNLMCSSLNSYVATSKILSQQNFCAPSSNWRCDPFFMSRQHFYVGSCCNKVSFIVFVATQKVYHERVLSPLNLIFLLQLHFDVAT